MSNYVPIKNMKIKVIFPPPLALEKIGGKSLPEDSCCPKEWSAAEEAAPK